MGRGRLTPSRRWWRPRCGREPNPTRDLVRVAEQCASGCAANGNIPGLVYRSQDFSVAHTGSYLWKGSLTYVTGTHSLKAGYQHTLMTDDRTWLTNNQNLTYRFDNGTPNQLTQSISPWVNNARAGWDGLFLQDEWTRSRVTLQGAVRFDRARSWFPAQQEGPSRFLPTPILIPETVGIDSYKDITARMGVAADVFGNGRTALKLNIGKYLEGAGVSGNYANTNPSLRMPQTTSTFGTAGVTRAWTDANQNFVPDCDLLNPAAQDFRATGGDLCGVISNTNFGRNVLSNRFDPGILKGWGVRPSDWDLGVSLQQQLGARSSLDVTYTRRWFHGFSVVDNLSLQASDLTPFSVMAPLDPRLPGGGGYVVPDLYDVVPEKAGQVDNLVTDSASYGTWRQDFNGLDVAVNARIGDSLTLIAGTSTGQTVADNCDVRAHLPELATTTTGTTAFGAGLNASSVTMASPYCRVAYGILTQLRGLASYMVPKIDIQVAATFQSKPGAMLAANYAVPNAAVTPSLGRSLSGNAANVTVNLIEPGTLYGDRINQLDFRVAKILKYGRARTRIALDTYNAVNSSAVLTYNSTFVPGGTVAAAVDDSHAAVLQNHRRDRLVTTVMPRSALRQALARRLLLSCVIALAELAPASVAWAQDGHKQVLVLYSTRRDSEFSTIGESELPRTLEAGLSRNLDYYSEFIDVARFPEPSYKVAFADFIRLKYREHLVRRGHRDGGCRDRVRQPESRSAVSRHADGVSGEFPDDPRRPELDGADCRARLHLHAHSDRDAPAGREERLRRGRRRAVRQGIRAGDARAGAVVRGTLRFHLPVRPSDTGAGGSAGQSPQALRRLSPARHRGWCRRAASPAGVRQSGHGGRQRADLLVGRLDDGSRRGRGQPLQAGRRNPPDRASSRSACSAVSAPTASRPPSSI